MRKLKNKLIDKINGNKNIQMNYILIILKLNYDINKNIFLKYEKKLNFKFFN
jgi:hypothetical protein